MSGQEYIDDLESLIDGFRYELCHECGGDLIDHVISPDMFGKPHAWCRETESERS